MTDFEGLRVDVDCRGVVMEAEFPLAHRCPFVDEVDEGRIRIEWVANGETFELHSLADYLARFKDEEISHEALTERIYLDLGSMCSGVQSRWATAGATVVVTCGQVRGG